jgi:hypothetical protein
MNWNSSWFYSDLEAEWEEFLRLAQETNDFEEDFACSD